MGREEVVLCIVNGPWQAVSLVASLHELEASFSAARFVIIAVDMDEGSALHATTLRILRANGLPTPFTLAGSLAPRQLPAALARLSAAANFSFAEVTTLVSYGVHRPVGRYLAHHAPQAKLLIYEEGLRAYVQPSAALRERAQFAAAQLWGVVDREFGTAWRPIPASRATAYCLLLGDRLGVPSRLRGAEVHHVAKRRLQGALEALEAPALRAPLRTPFVLIVGQYYAELKQMSLQTELAAYTEAARAIARRGQVPVWRGHIRRHDRLLAPLRAGCPELRSFDELVDDPSLPLELYTELFTGRCAGVVSFSSSALFYLSYLHGITAHTLLSDKQLARMNYPHRDACALALAHLPRFDEIERAS